MTTASPATGLDGIKVVRNQLKNDAGQVIHLHGADMEGTEYACSQWGGVFDPSSYNSSTIANMVRWHVNFTRIGLNAVCVHCALGISARSCGAHYMTPIIDEVHRLNAAGIYVEVMLMWDLPGKSNEVGLHPNYAYQLAGGASSDNGPAAWKMMAEDFKNNPDVMLGIWGEDYKNYPDRLNGCNACNGVVAQPQTTPLTDALPAGATTSVTVNALGYELAPGEPIFLGPPSTNVEGAADTLYVAGTSDIRRSTGHVTIPVTGRLKNSYKAGTLLYYPNSYPGYYTQIHQDIGPAQSYAQIDFSTPAPGAQDAVNIMRGAGFNGPIVYTCALIANACSNPRGPPGTGSYEHGTWLTYHPTDPDHSIVAAVDFYGPTSTGQGQVCSGVPCMNETILPIVQAGFPVIMNEFGPSWNGSVCDGSYAHKMLPWWDAHASGYSAWVWAAPDPAKDCADLLATPRGATPNTNGATATSQSYGQFIHDYYTSHFPPNQ